MAIAARWAGVVGQGWPMATEGRPKGPAVEADNCACCGNDAVKAPMGMDIVEIVCIAGLGVSIRFGDVVLAKKFPHGKA